MSAPPYFAPIPATDAIARLRAGDLVILPTETVYGLAADAASADAVLKIFAAKKRPRFNPLICHCADLEMAGKIGVMDGPALALAQAFWPGPLTLVVAKAPGAEIPDIVTAGLDTVAVRVPAHPVAHQIISALGRPVAAPSANPSGTLSTTSAQFAFNAFGQKVSVVEGGPCDLGLESTIIAVTGGQLRLLRPGAIPRAAIEAVLGKKLAMPGPNPTVTAPGMLASHYAPRASLRLNASRAASGESWLGFGPGETRPLAPSLNLSPNSDMNEAARNLFDYLRRLDANGPLTIAVAEIPEEGLGEAINDRLRRAAAPRPQGR
jgi:L-threonylcarbamoyladenylate synthase